LKTRGLSSSELRIWEFVSGFGPKQQPIRRKMEKVGLPQPEHARLPAGSFDFERLLARTIWEPALMGLQIVLCDSV
jgi:hypothetical protein